ncbi:hypothetical protein EON65_26175 [archaeon]|nr:MAG: hypothetical protein EON65_26175 [archaeon]
MSVRSLKVNFSPYLLDIVLFDQVNSVHHKAIVKDGILHITLFKVNQALWGKCEAEGDKRELQAVKQEALQSQELLEEELKTKRTDRKVDEERTSVRKQMALEEEVRTRLETLQQEEKEAAEKEVYETFAKLQEQEAAKNAPKMSANQPAAAQSKKLDSIQEEPSPAQNKHDVDIFADKDIEDYVAPASPGRNNKQGKPDEQLEERDEEDIKYIPPPRSLESKVAIKHTPRYFPTPMRESKQAEEEDWIAKNRQHLKKHGVLGKNVGSDVTEEDPVWLKAKGDDFFRAGDAQSALNAYSAAIEADPSFLACYANRSACYLKLGIHAQCKADCDVVVSKSLEIADSQAKSEGDSAKEIADRMKLLASLVKTFIRRGAAYCQMGQFHESMSDYCQALAKYQLLTGSVISQLGNITMESIQSDIDRLKLLCHVEASKKEGDRLFGEKQLEGALGKYNAALSSLPVHVSSLSNRSACKLAMGDIEGAVQDCQQAVQLLQLAAEEKPIMPVGQQQATDMLAAILPPPKSAKRQQWLLKTLVRQAMALVQLDRIPAAIECYQHAHKLEPKDTQIAADLQKLLDLSPNNPEASDKQ